MHKLFLFISGLSCAGALACTGSPMTPSEVVHLVPAGSDHTTLASSAQFYQQQRHCLHGECGPWQSGLYRGGNFVYLNLPAGGDPYVTVHAFCQGGYLLTSCTGVLSGQLSCSSFGYDGACPEYAKPEFTLSGTMTNHCLELRGDDGKAPAETATTLEISF